MHTKHPAEQCWHLVMGSPRASHPWRRSQKIPRWKGSIRIIESNSCLHRSGSTTAVPHGFVLFWDIAA